MQRPVRVCKFGGSSVADEHLLQVAHLIAGLAAPSGPLVPVVVVSAMAGVTDALIRLTHVAASHGVSRAEVSALFARYHRAAEVLPLQGEQRMRLDASLSEAFQALFLDLANVPVRGTSGEAQVIGWGERLSVLLLTAALESLGVSVAGIDESVIVTEPLSALGAVVGAQPRLEETNYLVCQRVLPLVEQGIVPILPGYLGCSLTGEPTLLSRGGSDLTATLIAGALPACQEVEIWSDVSGVWSANPGPVPEATPIPVLSFVDAARLARAGAKVLHPQTLQPLAGKSISVRVLNSFAPEEPGSLIVEQPAHTWGLEALAARRHLTLLTYAGLAEMPAWLEELSQVLPAGDMSGGFSMSQTGAGALLLEAPLAQVMTRQLQGLGAQVTVTPDVAACTYLSSQRLDVTQVGQALVALAVEQIAVLGVHLWEQEAVFWVADAEASKVERTLHQLLIRQAALLVA